MLENNIRYIIYLLEMVQLYWIEDGNIQYIKKLVP